MKTRHLVLVLCLMLVSAVAVPLLAAPGDYAEIGGGGWSDMTLMAALDGALWIIDDGTLYKVDKAGKYTEIGEGGWTHTTAMTALDGLLWIIDDGTLYRVTTK